MKRGSHHIATDWMIFKNAYLTLLIHYCPNDIPLDVWIQSPKPFSFSKNQLRTYCGIRLQHEQEVAAWDYKGKNYYCPRCDKDAPEEVEDIALLANAHRRLRGIVTREKYKNCDMDTSTQ